MEEATQESVGVPLNQDPQSDSLQLPSRVTHVRVDEKDVYLVGTAHVSKDSVEDVRTTIEQVRPDVVCIELCKARHQAITQADNLVLRFTFSTIQPSSAHAPQADGTFALTPSFGPSQLTVGERAGGCGNEEAASGEDGDAESAKALLDVFGRRAGEEPGAGHRVDGGRLINEGSRQRIQPLDNPRS